MSHPCKDGGTEACSLKMMVSRGFAKEFQNENFLNMLVEQGLDCLGSKPNAGCNEGERPGSLVGRFAVTLTPT